MNQHKDIITEYYDNYDEDSRFSNGRGTEIEYITTMHYINKFASKGAKILELGAATGVYAIELARQGYDVTALELVQKNVDILKQKANGIKNLTAMQGDALDLSRFEDDMFDMVLSFGPMYHLFNEQDKHRAIHEAIRVCKKNGVLMFAYLTHSSIVWNFGVKKQQFVHLAGFLTKEGRIQDVPEEVFSSYFIEDFAKQFVGTPTEHMVNASADCPAVGRELLSALPDEQYKLFIDWHLNTCERADQQGLSSHMLYICKKI